MCTAQQKCHGTSLVPVVWASLLILQAVPGWLASATPTPRKSRSAIFFPSSCTPHQQDTDQVAILWQSIHDHPTAGAYNTLGVLYAAADRLACAIPAFASALRLDSTNWESHYNLALALLRKGDHNRAADELRSAIHEKPDSAAAHFALGTLFKNEQKWSLAKQELNKTLGIDPHQADASIALAEIAMESGDHAAAISLLQTALNSKPPAPQAELLEIALASTYAEIGDREKALDILKTLVRDRPDSANAHFSLGELYARLDQQNTTSDALSEYEQALRLSPGMEKARLASGTTLILLKRYPDAVTA